MPEMLAHEQTRATGMVQAVPGAPDLELMGLPIMFDGEIRGAAPA